MYPQKERWNWVEKIIFLFIAKIPLTSWIYGYLQKLPLSKKKIRPFVKAFSIDENTFEKKVDEFESFNDFFIRKLKKNARMLDLSENGLICPADGRVKIYPEFPKEQVVDIKGRSLSLEALTDEKLPWKGKTAVVLIRLAPMDYHRFHFPIDGELVQEKVIKGSLFSVNPIALKKNISYLYENKRVVSRLYHPLFNSIYKRYIHSLKEKRKGILNLGALL
ncbi:MAG: hypothetical protein EBU93_05465 [Chlamydiae bacterium]|nr:hypothetical protein [Chlamydiota bacterium]